MTTTAQIAKKETAQTIQPHDYAGSIVAASLVIATAILPAQATTNNDELQINLANHIEAFCDCV